MKKVVKLVVPLLVLLLLFTAGCVSQSTYREKEVELEVANTKIAELVWEKEALEAEKDQLFNEVGLLRDEKENLVAQNALTKTQWEQCKRELEGLRELYPPRYFRDYNELRDWVNSHPIGSSWESHLRIQRIALQLGYIWSVQINRETLQYVSSVIAGDSVYWVFGSGTIEWVCVR